jgi:ABC-type transporter Mla subunit MlaD
MTPLFLPSQTLARLRSRAEGGHDDARVLLYLIARADKRDQEVAKFVDSYSSTIAALCRRLEDLERGANDLPTPAAPVDDSSVADALTVAEAALADVAEGEIGRLCSATKKVTWAELRCTEALAAIRPVMKEHGIRTSEWPAAASAPVTSTPPPTALVEVVGNELPLLPDGRVDEARTRAAIRKVAAWLDSQGHHASANVVRRALDR